MSKNSQHVINDGIMIDQNGEIFFGKFPLLNKRKYQRRKEIWQRSALR